VEGAVRLPGPDLFAQARSRGIVKFTCEETEKDDHKRMAALRKKNEAEGVVIEGGCVRLNEWHFVLERDDGSVLTMHPNISNTKIQVKHGRVSADRTIPRTGLGGSSGPGTFTWLTTAQCDQELRFDPQKESPNPGYTRVPGTGPKRRAGPKRGAAAASSSGS
jgi:hypothetical protein